MKNSTAVLEPQHPTGSASLLSEAAEEYCVKCSTPNAGFAVCPSCGYYATLDKFVEVDRVMEGLEAEARPQGFRCPGWVFVLLGANVAVVVESSAAAVFLPLDSLERLVWSAVHLLGGLALFAAFQARGTFLALVDDLEVGIIDCLAWPPKAWESLAQRVPKTAHWFTVASVGLMSVVMSVAVLRAIPYRQMLTSDAPPKKYNSLLAKAINEAKKHGGAAPEQSMEEALQEFAEAAEDGEAGAPASGEELLAAIQDELQMKTERTARCIVVGFRTSESQPQQLVSLVVATASRTATSSQPLEVLGVVPVAGQPYAAKMLQQLQESIRPTPFVGCKLEAQWVEPQIRCEVTYMESDQDQQAVDLELKKLF
ncbi:MAG: hypothetical protein KDA45_00685 [Planctomycetales bacterium]|nr:hypothetical protein [Planctomycetales bacterium]